MKTIDQKMSKFKQPDLLKRKPYLKVCSNHLKDNFFMLNKRMIARRVYGGGDITLMMDDDGIYRRHKKVSIDPKLEKMKKLKETINAQHGQIEGVREAEAGNKEA